MRKLMNLCAYMLLASYCIATGLLALGAFGNQWAQQLLLNLVK